MPLIVEPLGHGFALSKVERQWSQLPVGAGLSRKRVERIDSVNLVAYSPMGYEMTALTAITTSPTDDEIMKSFLSFVRDEFGTENSSVLDKLPGEPNTVQIEIARIEELTEYIAEAEQQFIYGPYVSKIRSSFPNVGEFIFELVCDTHLGNSSNRRNVERSDFLKKIYNSYEKQDRLMIAFLGLPFKDQNPTRTNASAAHSDFAELGMLIQLHMQALAFFQLHPFGVDFVAISDGSVYAPIFGVDEKIPTQYLSRIRFFRNALNLQGSIHIIDLKECIERLSEAELECFNRLRDRTRNLLKSLPSTNQTASNVALESLIRGMRRNLNSAEECMELSWSEKITLIYHPEQIVVGSPLSSRSDQLTSRSKVAALEYAAVNVALRYHNLVSRQWGNPIRGTIHPKPGQVALPRSGSTYPWNGVGVLDRRSRFPGRIRSSALGELMRHNSEWVAGVLPGENAPAYYVPFK